MPLSYRVVMLRKPRRYDATEPTRPLQARINDFCCLLHLSQRIDAWDRQQKCSGVTVGARMRESVTACLHPES